MPPETDALLRSIRRWLMAITFLLGVGVVTLADTGYVLTDYQDGVVFALAGIAGGAIAVAAVLTGLLGFFSTESPS